MRAPPTPIPMYKPQQVPPLQPAQQGSQMQRALPSLIVALAAAVAVMLLGTERVKQLLVKVPVQYRTAVRELASPRSLYL